MAKKCTKRRDACMCRVVVLLILGPVHTYTFLTENGDFFSSGLAHRRHVSGENGHGKNASFQRRPSESLIFNCDNCHSYTNLAMAGQRLAKQTQLTLH